MAGEVKRKDEKEEVRRGFTTLFGDRNQLISRGMRIYTWSVSFRFECELRRRCQQQLKTCQEETARPARIPEMCGEERGAAIKSRAPIYGGISRLSEGRERVEIELVPSFLHSVLTSLFLGVAHISRNDRIIFQSSAAVRLECPTGQRAFVPRGI